MTDLAKMNKAAYALYLNFCNFFIPDCVSVSDCANEFFVNVGNMLRAKLISARRFEIQVKIDDCWHTIDHYVYDTYSETLNRLLAEGIILLTIGFSAEDVGISFRMRTPKGKVILDAEPVQLNKEILPKVGYYGDTSTVLTVTNCDCPKLAQIYALYDDGIINRRILQIFTVRGFRSPYTGIVKTLSGRSIVESLFRKHKNVKIVGNGGPAFYPILQVLSNVGTLFSGMLNVISIDTNIKITVNFRTYNGNVVAYISIALVPSTSQPAPDYNYSTAVIVAGPHHCGKELEPIVFNDFVPAFKTDIEEYKTDGKTVLSTSTGHTFDGLNDERIKNFVDKLNGGSPMEISYKKAVRILDSAPDSVYYLSAYECKEEVRPLGASWFDSKTPKQFGKSKIKLVLQAVTVEDLA